MAKKKMKQFIIKKNEVMLSNEFGSEVAASFTDCNQITIRTRRGNAYFNCWRHALRHIYQERRAALTPSQAEAFEQLAKLEEAALARVEEMAAVIDEKLDEMFRLYLEHEERASRKRN